jgi:hypothetical protein
MISEISPCPARKASDVSYLKEAVEFTKGHKKCPASKKEKDL